MSVAFARARATASSALLTIVRRFRSFVSTSL
jgi:hypothetical protein